MKKYIHVAFLIFAITVLILTAIWLTNTYNHKTVETHPWVIDSLAYYKGLVKKDSASSDQHHQQYEDSYTHYLNPDSAGREKLRAIIWKRARGGDSLSGATP